MTTIYYNDYPVPIASEPRETYRTAHVQTPAEKYNLNFMFGPVRDLESRYIRLEPLIPSRHAQAFLCGSQDPVIQSNYTVNDIGDVLDYLEWSRRDQGVILFAILAHPSLLSSSAPTWSLTSEPSSSWSFSGIIGLFHSNLSPPSADLGIYLWSHARGRGISDQALTLMIKWGLNPSDPIKNDHGLGLGWLKYATDKNNSFSRGLAGRLGIREYQPSQTESETNANPEITTAPSDWTGLITRQDWEGRVRSPIDETLKG